MAPHKGQGEKEADGSIRDYPVFCRLPLWKVKIVDEIAKLRGMSRTDVISESIDLWLRKNSVYTEESINISKQD